MAARLFSWPRPAGIDAHALFAAAPGDWAALLEDPRGGGRSLLFSREGVGRCFGPGDAVAFGEALRALQAEAEAMRHPAPLAVVYLAYEAGGWFERLPAPKGAMPQPWAWLHRPRWALLFDRDRLFVRADDAEAEREARRVWTAGQRAASPAPPAFGPVAARPDGGGYRAAVRRARDYIAAGDVFQVNLARFFEAELRAGDAAAIYARLRARNPAPFAGLARIDGDAPLTILSSSPERLVRVHPDRTIETRPIAGTRRRGRSDEDDALRAELLLSPKERAEHVMLVDLERNDLGRVCVPGSVRVDELMTVERYATVQHIVSNVRGRLRDECGWIEVIAAMFPGGTITGCPKVRAMEIIHELESGPRGPYTGALGYLAADGTMDLNILIRTCWLQDGRLHWAAGAGIVADSDPARELDEVAHKAAGIERALGLQRRR